MIGRLLSVNVGLPREITWRGQTVRTAIWKDPVPGKRMVRRLNIDGDGQGDLAGHGGEHRAVFVYQMDSYHYWEEKLHRSNFAFGQFGENFTVEGLPDNEVCIGDQISHRWRPLRSHPAASHMLSNWHQDGRTADARSFGYPWQAWLLSSRAAGR